MDGFNATIFAYGQSVRVIQGSGKTFTMLGPEDVTTALINDYTLSSLEIEEKSGIIPQSIFYIFEQVNAGLKDCIEYTIKCSYLEIYNESVNDLLSNPPAHNLRIREFPRLGMCVIGALEQSVVNPEDVFACLALGTVNRITSVTEMNQRSSRSHTLFIITVEQKMMTGSTKCAKLSLVDLAGSEKVSKSGASGQQLKEAQNINLSLTTLGRCIKALSASKEEHIPFRESKLTMILKEALGGNAKTSLICAISQKQFHSDETKGTLKFAERAKKVQTKARSNVKKSQEELVAIIDQLKVEINNLRRQMKDKEESVVSRPCTPEEDIYLKYAELKAQFESMVENSQFEIEQLKARVEQLLEPSMRYPLQLQEQLDRIEELNQHITAIYSENEQLRKRHESEVLDVQNRVETANLELEIRRKEVEATNAILVSSKEQLYDKEQELEQAVDQIKMYEDIIKSKAEEITSLKTAVSCQSNQILDGVKEYKELREKVKEMSDNETNLQSVLLQSQATLSQSSREIEESKAQISSQSVRILSLEQDIGELRNLVATKETQLAELLEDSKRTNRDLQTQLLTLNLHLEETRKPSHDTKPEAGIPSPAHAKQMLGKLLKEMSDLQVLYHDSQQYYKQEIAKTKQAREEQVRELDEK